MKLSRPSRVIAALIALVSILFMQFAVAAYACPEYPLAGTAEASISAGHMKMPGCAGMDDTQPNLCHAHDHAGNQSIDKPPLPHIQPFNPAMLVLTLDFSDPSVQPASLPPRTDFLARASAPPLSIRHCCFRI